MPDKQIFFDPQRKRWKRLRRILDATAVIFTLVLAAFIFNVLRNQQLPELLLPTPKHNYKALARPYPLLRGAKDRAPRAARPPASPPTFPSTPAKVCAPPTTCRTTRPATPRSRSTSTRSICSFPSGCTSTLPDGNADGHERRHAPRVSGDRRRHGSRPRRLNKIKRVIQAAREDTEIFPHLNNFNPRTQTWDPAIGAVLTDAAQARRAAPADRSLLHRVPRLSRPFAGH